MCRVYCVAVQTDVPIRQMPRLQHTAGFDVRVDLHVTDGDGRRQIRGQGLHVQRLWRRLPLRRITSVEVVANGGKSDGLFTGSMRGKLPSQA